jgi:hypothetical protein
MRPVLLACLLLLSRPSLAQPPEPPASLSAPGTLCQAAIEAAQAAARLPKGLLGAIGVVESGRPDAVGGAVRPWPWTIDAAGQPAFFASREDAIAAVQALQARGVASIDVGCMQVNLMHHPQAFASLEDALDPTLNARYAARFLRQLWGQTHDWANAAALYHSTTPEFAQAYQERVLAAWGMPPVPPIPPPLLRGAAAGPIGGRVAVMLPIASGQDIRVIPLARTPSANR